jgi:hypothetical protein
MNIEKTKRIAVRQESSETPITLTRRGRAALVLAGAAASVMTGYGVHEVQDRLPHHDVGSQSTTLGQGEAPQSAVERAVEEIANDHKFDVNKVDGIVHAAQDAYDNVADTTGYASYTPQPGDTIEVTVSKNGFGDYDVEATASPVAEPTAPADKTSADRESGF